MKVTIVKEVTSCSNCPHLDNGPYDLLCTLYDKEHGVYSSISFLHRRHSPKDGKHIENHIPKECPLR